jgi:hypothetical protein
MALHTDPFANLAQLNAGKRLWDGMERGRRMEALLGPSTTLVRHLELLDEVDRRERFQKLLDDQWFIHSAQAVLADQSWVQDAALRAASLQLPTFLEASRTPFESLSLRIAELGIQDFTQPGYLEAFNQATAMADFLASKDRIDRAVVAAGRSFSALSINETYSSISSYGRFLDAAGLYLPHWPSRRLLTRAERHRRIRSRLKENTPPKHVIQASTLVRRYELTLREIIDAALCDVYGDDWAEARLVVCDCKDLLGKWRVRGGHPLDFADFAHYSKIMCNEEHFDAVFQMGFDDIETLKNLLALARKHRGSAIHGREFSPQDLKELRVAFRQLEIGLAALDFPDDEDDLDDV